MILYNNMNNLYKTICNKLSSLSTRDEIKTRMNKYINKNNKKCHPYKPFIVTLKSKQILSYFNYLTCIDDKLKFIDNFNEIMIEISSNLYKKFDPHMIYTFHDEIHLVFYYNEQGNYIYSGDINKIITTFVSCISIEMTKILIRKSIDLDFVYKGYLVEFDEDYEVLNYIIWRQLDCKRNIITLLYKCVNLENYLNNKDKSNCLKLDVMEKNISRVVKEDLNKYYAGNILKKSSYYMNKNESNISNSDDNLIRRKNITVENFYLTDNFKENLNKYIRNKIM